MYEYLPSSPNEPLSIGGHWDVECINPDGSVAWKERVKNGVVNTALNDLIQVYLASGTQKTAWSIGLIDNNGYSAIAASDTIASHSGWAESTAYSETTRQTWTPGAVSNQQVSNPTPATFTANGSVTIQGFFLVSNNTKGGSTGLLWATGILASPQVLSPGQQVQATYSLSAASS